MLARYRMFAGYNAWCNERLYEAAAQIPDADYRADRGVLFPVPPRHTQPFACGRPHLDAAFYRSGRSPAGSRCHPLRRFPATARGAPHPKMQRIRDYIGSLTESDLSKPIRYRTFVNPQDIEQILAPALDHFFNHQTHHRGQAHALVSGILGNDRTPSFDLIIYQRETGEGTLRTIG